MNRLYLNRIISFAVFAAVLFLLSVSGYCETEQVSRIQPLANEHVILYRSPDPENVYLYDPCIAVCPNGRLIGAFSLGGPGAKSLKSVQENGVARIYTSDDVGVTWQYRSSFDMYHFTIFVANGRLYILGHRNDLKIIASDDWGDSWSEASFLTKNQSWHGSGTNLWYKDQFIYLVKERLLPGQMKGGWRISECAPVLLRGDTKKDLTKKESWTFSSEMTFRQTVNDKELDWFGVPYHPGFYPETKRNVKTNFNFPPIGWLEANVVQILDPAHYWYDPSGRTFHIFLRAHTGITNLACMIKAVEQEDGMITTMLQETPSGKKWLYLPWPGGQMKFCVVYDEKTKLYWLLNTQTTDSMTRPELLPEDRYGLADNQRRRLVLHFSNNMVDWCFAGLVAVGPADNASRHYANMVIHDDDLLIMSRSGDLEAKDAHNGNIITFHRVHNFRELVY